MKNGFHCLRKPRSSTQKFIVEAASEKKARHLACFDDSDASDADVRKAVIVPLHEPFVRDRMPCEAGAAHVYYALIVAAAEHQLQVLALLYKFAVNQRVYKAEQLVRCIAAVGGGGKQVPLQRAARVAPYVL